MGYRVLVLDDEALIGMAMSMVLEDEGYEVMGPYSKPGDVLDALAVERPDCALLDVNLGAHGTSEPVTAELSRRGIPFALLTGYSQSHHEFSTWGHARLLAKPCDDASIMRAVRQMIKGS